MSNAALALLRKQIGERTEKAKSLTPTSSIESVISQSGSQEIQDNRILAQPSDENRKLREELEKLVSENKLLQKNLDNNHIAKKELEVTKDNLENSLQEAKRELEEERQLSKQWQQKLSGLQGQLDAALSKAHQQDETLQQLVTEKDQLTNQHQALQSQLKERKMEVDELKAQLYTKEAEMNSLKGTLDKQNQTLPLPETSQDLLQELNSSQERLVACLTELESTRSTCNRLAEELYTVEQNYKSQLFLLQTTVANQAEEISNYTLQNATLERNLFDVKNGVNKNLGELVENNKLLKARNSQIEEVIKVQCLGIKTVFLEFKDCWQYFIQSMKEMRTFHHQLVETKEYILKILKAINEQSIFSSTQLMMCKQELEEQQSQTKSLITLKHNLERQMEDILANNMFLQQEIQRMSDLYYKQAEENEAQIELMRQGSHQEIVNRNKLEVEQQKAEEEYIYALNKTYELSLEEEEMEDTSITPQYSGVIHNTSTSTPLRLQMERLKEEIELTQNQIQNKDKELKYLLGRVTVAERLHKQSYSPMSSRFQ